jgi:hypothetical protein
LLRTEDPDREIFLLRPGRHESPCECLVVQSFQVWVLSLHH